MARVFATQIGKKPFPLKREDGDAKTTPLGDYIRLETRADCEDEYEQITNQIKNGELDAKRGNAMLRTISTILWSKSNGEKLKQRVAEQKALLRRVEELEKVVERLARGNTVRS